ncbi:hypothetical protein [Bradyrhizobium canariense]|uniref:Uncharacterized protein n=1 Tax=Bradyrhizobium canariense TaxID=255045 RepID=A0A1H2BRD8_9BRAD|nr:hypothetical protein [Bradyrhizobium canariense]SDT60346.1 hypothetical protein SAMN05444158_7423 [Bradyrhizobium canariense]
MKHEPNPPIAIMADRMKPLPRRHRIAHLRALIGQQPLQSTRRRELAALLRDETTAQAGEGGCAV